MKLNGFRIVKATTSVRILALERFDVPIETVVEQGLCSVPVAADGRVGGQLLRGLLGRHDEYRYPLVPIAVREGAGVVNHYGFVEYDHRPALIDFLARKLVPRGKTPVEALMRRLRGCRRRRAELGDFLFGRGAEWKPEHGDGTFPGFSAICSSEMVRFNTPPKATELAAGPVRFGQPEEGGMRMSIARLESVSGLRIPVCDSVTIGEGSLCVWERGSFRWNEFEEASWKTIGRLLGDPLVRRLDRSGTARAHDPAEPLLPAPDLRAVMLVRVPRGGPRAAIGRVPPPPPSIADAPMTLHDTRGMVRIPSDLPVLTRRQDVLGILLRTKQGVYVPGDAPTGGLEWLPDDAGYFVGMRLK